MEEIEKIAENSKAVCDALFETIVKKDLESGVVGGLINPDELKERYETAVNGSSVWEILGCKISQWKDAEAGKQKKADASALSTIFQRHRRVPSKERIEQGLGKQKAEKYKAALEQLESVICMDREEGKKKERWKTKSLEIIFSLIVDVISLYYGTGNLMQEYEKWRRSTYSSSKHHDAGASTASTEKLDKVKGFWRGTGIWVICKGDEKKWREFAKKCKDKKIRQTIDDTIKLCRKFRGVMKTTRNPGLRFIPKKKPSSRSANKLKDNLDKIKAYLQGTGSIRRTR